MLGNIAALWACSQNVAAKSAARDFLGNRDIQVLYSHDEAYNRLCNEAEICLQAKPDYYSAEVENRGAQIAGRVHPFTKQKGLGRWWLTPKSSQQSQMQNTTSRRPNVRPRELTADGKRVRMISSLSSPTRVVHNMAADILRVTYRPPIFIWDAADRGKDAMTKRISAAIEEGQYHAYVGDVASSFESFALDCVRDVLPLPNCVADNLLDAGSVRWTRDYRKEAIVNGIPFGSIRGCDDLQGGEGPIGLVPGSNCSNIIQGWIFSLIVQDIPPGCTLFIYSDNVLVLGRNKRTVRAFARRLEAWFSGSPFGPFLLRGSFENARSFFDFVGYQHSKNYLNRAEVSISVLNSVKLPKKIAASFSDEELVQIILNSDQEPPEISPYIPHYVSPPIPRVIPPNEVSSRTVEHPSVTEAVRLRLTGFSAVSNMQFEIESLCTSVLDEMFARRVRLKENAS
jgi:hypothetical protein